MSDFDPTEAGRRELVQQINGDPGERAELEAKYGQVWDTAQLQQDFVVHAFLAPFIRVTRKSDKADGLMCFQHHPRYYFGFEPSNP